MLWSPSQLNLISYTSRRCQFSLHISQFFLKTKQTEMRTVTSGLMKDFSTRPALPPKGNLGEIGQR